MAKRGMNIYQRKDGRWEGRVKLAGEEKYRSVYGKSLSVVKEKMALLQRQTTPVTTKCSMTVKELFGLWLGNIRHKVKDSTYANYITKLEKHIYPALGSLKFEKLTSKHIDDFINKKLSCGRIGGGELSTKYVADMVVLMKSMGKFAAKEYGFHNPLVNISAPKVEQKPLDLPPKNSQQKLINFLLDNPCFRNLGILICLFTGIRIGELCALKFSDIDFEERVLRVNKTVQRVKSFDGKCKTKLIITTPKSAKSNREIPLPDFLFALFLQFRKGDDCYILSGTKQLVEPRLMQYYFQTVLKKTNLPSFNFHALRAMFATNCVEKGFDIKTLSEILGHSSVEVTLKRYVFSSKERKRECMNLLKPTAA